MSENATEVLAGFAAGLQYDDVPDRVRDHCKNVLLDTLACAVAGHRGEETEQLAALAKDYKVYYKKVEGKTPTSYSMDHSAASFVYDTEGRVRLYARYGRAAGRWRRRRSRSVRRCSGVSSRKRSRSSRRRSGGSIR